MTNDKSISLKITSFRGIKEELWFAPTGLRTQRVRSRSKAPSLKFYLPFEILKFITINKIVYSFFIGKNTRIQGINQF